MDSVSPLVEGPTAYSDSSAARGIANRIRRWEAQASSGQKSLVTTGQSGCKGKSRRVRHVAEYSRLGDEVFGRGTTEAIDWNAASART